MLKKCYSRARYLDQWLKCQPDKHDIMSLIPGCKKIPPKEKTKKTQKSASQVVSALSLQMLEDERQMNVENASQISIPIHFPEGLLG